MNVHGQRTLFQGPPVEVPLPREVAIFGGTHPHVETSWCSCCHEDARVGVTVRHTRAGERSFVFFCKIVVELHDGTSAQARHHLQRARPAGGRTEVAVDEVQSCLAAVLDALAGGRS